MNTFLNFLESRKQFITESFNSKDTDKAFELIDKVLKKHIDGLVPLIGYVKTKQGSAEYYSKQYMVVPKKNPEKSSVFQINFSQTKDKSDVYSIDFFKDAEILFDGKPIENIKREVFTSSLAVVDQDIIMFEGTIAENIKMWDKSIEDFEMILAARDAQIHNDIIEREGGYDSAVIENGQNFSGGQKQRLEIARTLAQDPSIIILDEATSALDAKTEFEVVKAISDRGITCIVVAHRLSTIRDCDEIIVLDNGKVVERGTHEELYAKNGVYTNLVTME